MEEFSLLLLFFALKCNGKRKAVYMENNTDYRKSVDIKIRDFYNTSIRRWYSEI